VIKGVNMNEPKFGVYIHPKTAKVKVLTKVFDEKEKRTTWELEEGMFKNHPLFRLRVPVVKSMSVGWPVYEWRCDLKGYEYMGDL
jgi:hypothetical protein